MSTPNPIPRGRPRLARVMWMLGKRVGTGTLRHAAGGAGPFSRFGEEAIIGSLVKEVSRAERLFVDIGAGDGVNDSNTYALARSGWRGLAIDSSPVAFAALAGAYQSLPQVLLTRASVDPATVVSVVAASGVPKEFALLSLDIDGYDYFVLEALLDAFRPSLICAEINEKIPPPVKFTVLYDPEYPGPDGHFYGQSISQLQTLVGAYRYEIVALEYNNVFLVPAERNSPAPLDAETAYRHGYLDRLDRLERLPWNADMEALHRLTPEEAVSAINQQFASHQGEYLCTL